MDDSNYGKVEVKVKATVTVTATATTDNDNDDHDHGKKAHTIGMISPGSLFNRWASCSSYAIRWVMSMSQKYRLDKTFSRI